MLNIENLSYTYKGKNAKPVLNGISLKIGKGFTFLVGENGSGKSTLLKLIGGILPLTRGSIDIDGIPVGSMEYRRALSYLPQVFNIYPQLKVREILSFTAGLKGVSANIDEAAALTGIDSFLDKKLSQCSEGMRRRVGIAATLIGDAEVVMMDEPTAGVDPKERMSFYRMVEECFRDRTVIISTHVLSDADCLAEDIVMLSRGSTAYFGSYEDYRHALDGRVFSIDCSELELAEVQSRYIVLSTEWTNLGYRCHVLDDDGGGSFPMAEATMEDVWLYYERRY